MKLVESYKKSLCKCGFKGGWEPLFVKRKENNPYFRSKPNSLKEPIADFFCNNKKIVDLVFNAFLLSKIKNPVLHWLIAINIINAKNNHN